MHSVSPLFLLPAAPLCGHRCFAEWKADTTPHIYKSDSLNQYWTLRVLLRGLFTINISFPPYLGGWNWHFLRLSLSLASQFKPIRGAKCLGSVKGPFRCIYVALAGVFYSEQIVLTRCRYCEMHDWIMSADADEAKGGSDGKTWDLSWNIRRNSLCFVLWHTASMCLLLILSAASDVQWLTWKWIYTETWLEVSWWKFLIHLERKERKDTKVKKTKGIWVLWYPLDAWKHFQNSQPWAFTIRKSKSSDSTCQRNMQ